MCSKEAVGIKIYSEDFAAGNCFVYSGMLAGAVEITSKIESHEFCFCLVDFHLFSVSFFFKMFDLLLQGLLV